MQSLCTKYSILTLLTAGLLLAGCDTAGPDENGGETKQVQGRVTDEQSYGSRAAQDEQAAEPSQVSASAYAQSAPGVEGAVVTASSVNASGSTQNLSVSGQSTTQAEGQYDIDVAGATNVLLLTANKSSNNFTSKVLVYTEGRSQLQAMPMTVESEGESNVYVEAKEQDDDGASVTVADVAAHVDGAVAADLESGDASASDVAASIRSSIEAEGSYYSESGESEADQEEAEDNKQSAFLQLQNELSAASSAQAQTAAIEAFEQAVANAYVNAGASVEGQAKAKQTGSSAAVHYSGSTSLSSSARLGLRKKAELLAAIATARAVRAQFENNGASSAQLSALADARANLIASLRSAASAQAVADAKSEYRAAVETELENFLDVSASVVDAAQTEIGVAAESTLDTVLNAGIDLGGLASQFAQAYVGFYSDAEAAAQSSLQSNGASEAAAGASVLVLLEGMASIG